MLEYLVQNWKQQLTSNSTSERYCSSRSESHPAGRSCNSCRVYSVCKNCLSSSAMGAGCLSTSEDGIVAVTSSSHHGNKALERGLVVIRRYTPSRRENSREPSFKGEGSRMYWLFREYGWRSYFGNFLGPDPSLQLFSVRNIQNCCGKILAVNPFDLRFMLNP